MKIESPVPAHIPALRQIWQEAFGDSDAFLDLFFSAAFSPARSRCVLEADAPVAALYWFDHTCAGGKYAYLYAVATKASHRRRGLCRMLMADAQNALAAQGYAGSLLVPESDALAGYYATMGYRFSATHTAFSAPAGPAGAAVSPVSMEEYARLRLAFLPENSAQPDDITMSFLSRFSRFYAGPNLLFTVQQTENGLFFPEFLGDEGAAPQILTALGADSGTFRTPGSGAPFAMFLPLIPGAAAPQYLPFAFD